MKVNVSGKPKHTLDVNRNNDVGADKGSRSAATVRRLKMYNVRSKRGRKEKILKQDLQSKDLPNTRIEPDRLWFVLKGLGFGYLPKFEGEIGLETVSTSKIAKIQSVDDIAGLEELAGDGTCYELVEDGTG